MRTWCVSLHILITGMGGDGSCARAHALTVARALDAGLFVIFINNNIKCIRESFPTPPSRAVYSFPLAVPDMVPDRLTLHVRLDCCSFVGRDGLSVDLVGGGDFSNSTAVVSDSL